MEKLTLKSLDNYELDVHVFDCPNPKAVIQIIHGMEEHQERYEDFVYFLVNNGYAVVTSDMRGHGNNATKLGFFKERNGYEHLIFDQKEILNFIKRKYKDLPIYLFAHSMGTIISRNLIQTESQSYSKIALSGYPCYQAGAGMGIFFANLIQLFKGPYYKSKFLSSLSIGAFSKSIKNRKTDLDWLSYNEENVQKYINDPLCGFGFGVSAFRDLFQLVKNMHKIKRYKNQNTSAPVLLIAGEDDPCTGGVKGRKDSLNTFKKLNYQNIEVITYPHMRHEILNEKENQKVYQDILNFFNK